MIAIYYLIPQYTCVLQRNALVLVVAIFQVPTICERAWGEVRWVPLETGFAASHTWNGIGGPYGMYMIYLPLGAIEWHCISFWNL